MISRLGAKVRGLRTERGMSQTELARAIGLSDHSRGYVSEIESGKKIPPPEKILALAELFGVSTDYLLRDDFQSPE